MTSLHSVGDMLAIAMAMSNVAVAIASIVLAYHHFFEPHNRTPWLDVFIVIVSIVFAGVYGAIVFVELFEIPFDPETIRNTFIRPGILLMQSAILLLQNERRVH